MFDLLRAELQDCFNALKEVNPDQVYSSRRGTELGNKKDSNVNNNSNDDDDMNGENHEPQPGISNEVQKKKPKSIVILNILFYLLILIST